MGCYMRSKLKSPFFWLILVAAIGFAILLYSSRGLLYETWLVIKTADIRLVLLLPAIQVVNYFFIGGYYRTMFGFFDTKISAARSWGVVASLNFVNQILPSGGLSGITYLAYGFRSNLAVGKTTMIQTGRYVFSLATYVFIVPFALALMFSSGSDEGSLNGVAGELLADWYGIATAIIFVILIVVSILLLRSVKTTQKVADFFRRVLNKILWIFTKREVVSHKTTNKLVRDFHDGIDFFKQQKGHLLKPYGYMMLSVSMELSIVYVSLLAVGAEVSFAVAFASFVAANIAGVVSIIPGDVGIHETVMVATLVAFGVPAPQALSAVLLYRVFNKVIFLPVGFYFYSVLLKPNKSEATQ